MSVICDSQFCILISVDCGLTMTRFIWDTHLLRTKGFKNQKLDSEIRAK